jgi:hypothetical protein
MLKQIFVTLFLLVSFFSIVSAEEKALAEIIVTESVLLKEARETAEPYFKTKRGNIYTVLDQEGNFVKLQILKSKEAWVLASDVRITVPVSVLPSTNTVLTNNSVVTQNLYSYLGQENYRFPTRSENKQFDIDVDGFYEVRASARDYSPKSRDTTVWRAITNDPVYQKIPRDVLLGPMQLNFKSKIGISGKLSDDLYVYYDIEQNPDLPSRYDVKVDYRDHHFQFFHLESKFQEGEYLNVAKSLRGAKYEYLSDSTQFRFATGKERSNSKIIEGFGSGLKTIKLSDRFILPSSMTIFVNNSKRQEGSDYTVDYYKGEVTFKSPPQVSDYYKIIYEASNPISDYLPVLARRSFMGIEYGMKSEKKVNRTLLQDSTTETLRYKKRQSDTFKPIVFNASYFERSVLSDASTFKELAEILVTLNIIDASFMLANDYSPVKSDLDIPTSSKFFVYSARIQEALDMYFFDVSDARRKFQAQQYSASQLSPEDLSLIESVTFAESVEIWNELKALGIIDGQGFIRNDIKTAKTLFRPESRFFSYETLLLSWLKQFLVDPDTKKESFFILKHRPLVLGSDEVTVNGVKLRSLVDYYVDYGLGTLSLLLPVSETDDIQIRYSYYLTGKAEEEFVGNYSKGPFQLKHVPVVNGSPIVYLNKRQLRDIDDYILKYDSGELYFNFEVDFPSIISIRYEYIQNKEEVSQENKSPIEFSTSFVREFMPTGEENIVSSIVSENITSDDVFGDIIQLKNYPLTNTANLKLSVNNNLLSESDYSIESTFKSQIRLTNSTINLDGADIKASYDYINGFSTTYTFYINKENVRANGVYNLNNDQFELTEVPIKYNGIKYIRFQDAQTGETVLLDTNSFEVISYGLNNDGNSISIAFKQKYLDSGYNESSLDSRYGYPGEGDSFTIVYDYTPNVSTSTGEIIKQMFAANVTAELSDKWSLNTEIAVAGNNFSENILDAPIKQLRGTGVDNQSYLLGHTNIVEDSEQVFLNGLSQTKNEDYSIIYKTGSIIFRNFTPGPDDDISVYYQYYQSGAEIAADSLDYSYASKVSAFYDTPSLNIKGTFKYIDSDFNSVGRIQEVGGSTVIESGLDWKLTQATALKGSFGSRQIFSKETLNNEDLFKRQHMLDSSLKTLLLNRINTNQTVRYQTDVADADPDNNNKRSEDSRVLAYESTYNLGKSSLSYNASEKLSDYLDQDAFVKTNTQVLSFSNNTAFDDVFLFGKLTLTPSYYRSLASNQYQDSPTLAYTLVDQYKLNSSFSPFTALRFGADLRYEEKKDQKKDAASYSLNRSSSYGIDSTYNPYSWLGLAGFYNHSEDLSPLLNQSSDIDQKSSYSINKFLPYYAILSLGADKGNFLLYPILKSNFTASHSEWDKISNNQRKYSNGNTDRYGISEIGILSSLKITALSYSQSISQSENTIPQPTVSRNESISHEDKYSGNLQYQSNKRGLKHISYAYVFSDATNDSENVDFATNATGNRYEKLGSDQSYVHSLSIKPPQLFLWNPFNRKKPIRLGNANFTVNKSNLYAVKENYQYSILANSNSSLLTTYYVDNRYDEAIKTTASLSPFNLFTVSGDYSPALTYFTRNGDVYTGSTLQDKLNYNLSSSVSPFSFLTLSAGLAYKDYTQYQSSSANISESQLKEAHQNNSSILDSYLFHESTGFNSSFTVRKYFLGFTGGIERIDKKEIDIIGNLALFEQNSHSGKIIFYFKRDMNLNYTLKFSRTNNSEGRSQSINFNWTPLKKTYTSIYLDYQFTQTTGFDFNDIQQENSVQGDGNYTKTQVINRDDIVQKGSLTLSLTFPINSSPYLNKFVIEGEGHIKAIDDKKDSANNFYISGMLFKGTLFF